MVHKSVFKKLRSSLLIGSTMISKLKQKTQLEQPSTKKKKKHKKGFCIKQQNIMGMGTKLGQLILLDEPMKDEQYLLS